MQVVLKRHDLKYVPVILLPLKDVTNSALTQLQHDIQIETKIRFNIECVGNDFFDREKNNKIKLIKYV